MLGVFGLFGCCAGDWDWALLVSVSAWGGQCIVAYSGAVGFGDRGGRLLLL